MFGLVALLGFGAFWWLLAGSSGGSVKGIGQPGETSPQEQAFLTIADVNGKAYPVYNYDTAGVLTGRLRSFLVKATADDGALYILTDEGRLFPDSSDKWTAYKLAQLYHAQGAFVWISPTLLGPKQDRAMYIGGLNGKPDAPPEGYYKMALLALPGLPFPDAKTGNAGTGWG